MPVSTVARVSTTLAAAAPWPFPPTRRFEVAERMAREAAAASAQRKAEGAQAARAASANRISSTRSFIAGTWPFPESGIADPAGPVSGHLWGCALDEQRPVNPKDKALGVALTLHTVEDEQELRAMSLEDRSTLLMLVALWAQDMGL
jgi:hypothetical protein